MGMIANLAKLGVAKKAYDELKKPENQAKIKRMYGELKKPENQAKVKGAVNTAAQRARAARAARKSGVR